jgi:hypothetical protein
MEVVIDSNISTLNLFERFSESIFLEDNGSED